MWWQQYKKELMSHRGEILLIAGALVVWTAFLLSRLDVWLPQVVAGTYWVPMGFLPLWALWTSVQLYRQEWRENTAYLMLSLPARAWVITSAKLAALLTAVVGFVLLIAAGGWLVLSRTGVLEALAASPEFAMIPREWMVKMALFAGAVMLAGFAAVALAAQFAYVFSRLFSRFRGLVMVWTWILLVWLVGRVSELGWLPLGWLPDIYVRSLHIVFGIPEFALVKIESGPIVAVALFFGGLYTLLNAMLERAVEV